MAASLGVSQLKQLLLLWDIRQPVKSYAKDTARNRYQKTTSEDTGIFRVCKQVRLL
jgi:hypothetical protein